MAKKTVKKGSKSAAKTSKKTVNKKSDKAAMAKAAESAKKLAALKKKPKDELTPIEKAQLARASGKGSKKKAKKVRIAFKAPSDLKPIFVRADISIGKDGHMTQSRLTAIKGKLDSDTAKVIELSKYDAPTANAMVARLAGPLFIKSEKKRLPAGLLLKSVFRVAKSAKTGALVVRLKDVQAKMPEKKAKTLAKKDPFYRVVRKAARPLEAAFTKLKPFPSNKELKALTTEASAE